MSLILVCLLAAGCGRTTTEGAGGADGPASDAGLEPTVSADATKKPDGVLPTPSAGQDGTGWTPQEAIDMVWPLAGVAYDNAVLWRMIPADEKDAHTMRLASDWRKTGKSNAWFLWYADPAGENWGMFRMTEGKARQADVGTRSFSQRDMPEEWPRGKLPVSLKKALDAAVAQGADADGVSWVEYTVDAGVSGFNDTPYWIFDIATTLPSGTNLQYRMFVHALTGKVDGAVNLRGEAMTLPIDPEQLAKPREADHQADLVLFLDALSAPDRSEAVRRLSHRMCPDEQTGQMWLTAFESLSNVEVVSITPARQEEWTEEWEAYQVVLSVKTDATPDQFGWDNGENTRWISLIPQGTGGWKVDEFSANP